MDGAANIVIGHRLASAAAAIVLDFGFCGFGGIFIFLCHWFWVLDDVRKDLRLSVAYPVGLSGPKIRLQHST